MVHEIPAEWLPVRCETNRPSGPSAETVERVREAFVRSPQKSTTRASRELQMSQSSVWRILRKRLRVKGFRLQLLQALNPQDHNLLLRFCLDFQQRLLEDGFAEKLVFSDETTFHGCGKVNRHNVRIWGRTACSFRISCIIHELFCL